MGEIVKYKNKRHFIFLLEFRFLICSKISTILLRFFKLFSILSSCSSGNISLEFSFY